MQDNLINKLISRFIFCLLILSTHAVSKESNDSEKNNKNLKNDLSVLFKEKTSLTEKNAAVEYAQWSEKLHQHLANSDDVFTQAMVLASRVSSVQNSQLMSKINNNTELEQQLSELSYQPIADALNLLIAQDDLSPDTMDLLTHVCFYAAIKDHCHANILLQKRMQQDSDNLQVFLRPFELAVKANNAEAMRNLVTLMANSEISRSVLFITPKMNQLIDEFLAENPVPQSTIGLMVVDYKKLSGVSENTKNKLTDLMPMYMPFYAKTPFYYLNDMPPYRPLLDYCQTHINAVEHCRDISKIMINRSNSMLDKGIGHSILIASFELEGNSNGIKAAKALNEKFKKSYKCIQKIANGLYPIDNNFDPEFQKITLKAIDEFEMIIQQAEHNYKKLKANGDDSAVNPDSCFESH